MAYLTFYNPYHFANRDENANAAFEQLNSRFNTCDGHVPAANITETDKEYSIDLALPGVDRNSISVKHENGFLYVNVEKKEETGERYDRLEFDYSGASRIFRTGGKIDADNITAKYENGILSLSLPKKEAHVKKPAQSIVIN